MSLRIIAGKFKGHPLKAPSGDSTRPTQGILREAVFNICQNEIAGARFLDLFAGSGAVGFEALSRGASHLVLVEQNRNAVMCIKENIAQLHVEAQVRLVSMNAERALGIFEKESALFDIVYIDPPYGAPTLLDKLQSLLSPQATVFVEERFQAKNKTAPPIPSFLELKSSRRFGIALIHQYVRKL